MTQNGARGLPRKHNIRHEADLNDDLSKRRDPKQKTAVLRRMALFNDNNLK